MLINDFTGVNLTNRKWSALLLTLIRIIIVAEMLWTRETQSSEFTTNFEHCDDNQFARSVATVVKICFDICCIRLMDQSFGTPLSPGHPRHELARRLTF